MRFRVLGNVGIQRHSVELCVEDMYAVLDFEAWGLGSNVRAYGFDRLKMS